MVKIPGMLQENVDYELIPGDGEHWHIRVKQGDYIESVISFGKISIDENSDQLRFDFNLIFTPDPDLTVEDLTLQQYCGRILTSLLEVAVNNGTLVAQDLKSGEVMATEEMHEEQKELYNEEHQSGTDDTEESVNQ